MGLWRRRVGIADRTHHFNRLTLTETRVTSDIHRFLSMPVRDPAPSSSSELPIVTPYIRTLILVCSLSILTACVPSPTGPEIEDVLRRETEETLWSAAGPWSGLASGGPMVRFEFSLTERPDGQLQGTGTIREADAAAPVPVTVAGTYNRPNLSLTFTGMVYEGRAVVGTFVASYDSASGVNGTLRLSGADYTSIQVEPLEVL